MRSLVRLGQGGDDRTINHDKEMVTMMPMDFRVAGVLAHQHQVELQREAARGRQLKATGKAAVAARSDLVRSTVSVEWLHLAAGAGVARSARRSQS